MEENNRTARVCDGQCQKCTLVQQTYCSAVRLHALMEHEQLLFSRIEHLEEAIDALGRRLAGENLIIAQGGDGAEKVSTESI